MKKYGKKLSLIFVHRTDVFFTGECSLIKSLFLTHCFFIMAIKILQKRKTLSERIFLANFYSCITNRPTVLLVDQCRFFHKNDNKFLKQFDCDVITLLKERELFLKKN